MSKFSSFVKDESGATAIEYGLLAALIGIALIVGATYLGAELNTLFSATGNRMNSATTLVNN